MRDLVVLVADKDMHFAVKGGLSRPEALGIREIDFDFRSHPRHDAGVRVEGAAMLASERHRFNHALMLFDHEGCGDPCPVGELEHKLDEILRRMWGQNAKAIVIEPEVDIWLWGSDNALAEAVDWQSSQPIRDWLRQRDFAFDATNKPVRPKEAFEAVERELRRAKSASTYAKITGRISLERCSDPAFTRLRNQLQIWFGLQG